MKAGSIGFIILCAVASMGGQLRLINRGLDQFDQSSDKTLMGTANTLLTKTHARGDDLAFYEILGALRSAPEVVKADITAKAGTWGTLVIQRSSLFRKRWRLKYALATVLLFGAWGAGLTALLLHSERQAKLAREQMQNLYALLEREELSRAEAQTRAVRNLEEVQRVLQLVVGGIDHPLLVLDARQRVAAISPSAIRRLREETHGDILGKSWVEIPSLAFAGPRIQKCLRDAGGRSWVPISVVE